MIVTTYTCDHCGHSQPTGDQMWNISIVIAHHNLHPRSPERSALWCRGCIEKLGLLPVSRPENKPPEPPPTIEDMIREIVRDEVGS